MYTVQKQSKISKIYFIITLNALLFIHKTIEKLYKLGGITNNLNLGLV